MGQETSIGVKMIKETITIRPKFKLSKSDHKYMLRAAKIMNISMSKYIRQALMRRLSGAMCDRDEK